MSAHDAPSQHRSYAPKSVRCNVLTVSDSRTVQNDSSGKAIQEALEGAGHAVTERVIVRDEPDQIRAAVLAAINRGVAA
jgi:molybdenum cofactor biosynthesis protein B